VENKMTNQNNVSIEQSMKAWENFKGFLESVGMSTGKTVEMAFKKGFNEGFEYNKKELEQITLEYKTLIQNDLVQAALSESRKLEEKPRDFMAEAAAAIDKVKGPTLKNHPDYDAMVVGTIKPATLPVEPEKPKKTISRKAITRNIRSMTQRKRDGELAVEILRAARTEMQLKDIIVEAEKRGVVWPKQSVSGFLIKAIEDGYNIERVGFGWYKYKGDASL
jgi:hypothetical protein